MTDRPGPTPAERLWEHASVRRVAATRGGRWLASRRSMRGPLDAIHDRRRRRLTPTVITAFPRTIEFEPARARSARRADGSVPVTRYIVLTEGRSGSTLLSVELGRRWPEIRTGLEEFADDRRDWVSFEDSLRRTYLDVGDFPIVGCKVLIGQASITEIRELLELEDMHVVLLRRRDLLRRHVSEKIARSTQQWQLWSSDVGPTLLDRSVTVGVFEFHERVRLTMRFFEDMEELTQHLPRIDVWYEDLETDLDGELRRIARFLGAGEPAHEQPPKLVRQNPEPLHLLVRNLDEVHAFLRDAGREDLIVDERSDTPSDPTSTKNGLGLSPLQTASIRLAFGPEDELPATCNHWLMSSTGVAIDRDTHRLDTLIRRRLRRAGLHSGLRSDDTAGTDADSELDRRHRASALTNLHLLALVPEVHRSLTDSGVDPLLAGGTAIDVRSATASRIHPMVRLDLVVPADSLLTARDALTAAGWLHIGADRFEQDGLRLSIRERILGSVDVPELERTCRSDADIIVRDGVALRVLSTSDQVLSSIIEGTGPARVGTIAWLIDLLFILTDPDTELDWSRIGTIARRHDRLVMVIDTLTELETLLPGIVPGDAVELLTTHDTPGSIA